MDVTTSVDAFDRAPFVEPLISSQMVLELSTMRMVETAFDFVSDLDRKLVFSVILPMSDIINFWRVPLAAALGVSIGRMSGSLSQRSLLNRLILYLPHIQVHPFDRSTRMATRISGIIESIPSDIYDTLVIDLSKSLSSMERPVWVRSGNGVHGRSTAQIRADRLSSVAISSLIYVRRAQRMLNRMSSRSFFLSDDVISIARSKCFEFEEGRRNVSLRSLREIQLFPQPIYHSSANTPRLYTRGYSLQNAPKWMRRALGPNWIELDLSNASLAIVQHDYNLPVARQYLSADRSVWDLLHKELFPESEFSAFKPALKKLINPCLMGGQLHIALGHMKEKYLSESGHLLPNRVTEVAHVHPLIKELVRSTAERREYIRNHSIFKISGGRSSASRLKTAAFEVNNLLSQEIFKGDWVLLNGVIQIAKEELDRERASTSYRARFKIMIWQHDGFSINVRRQEDREAVVRQLQEAVRQTAEEHGFLTSLMVDFPPDF